jgi:DNA-binding Lrp family transcriptional regulator
LRKNARLSNVEIAKLIGTSEGTIRNRIQKLIESKRIRKFTAKTGTSGIKAMIDVKVNVNINTSKVASRISSMPGIVEVYEISGEDDVVAIVEVPSTEKLNETIENIRATDSVTSTKTKLILKEY